MLQRNKKTLEENGHNTGCQNNKRNYRDCNDKNVQKRNTRTVEFIVKL